MKLRPRQLYRHNVPNSTEIVESLVNLEAQREKIKLTLILCIEMMVLLI